MNSDPAPGWAPDRGSGRARDRITTFASAHSGEPLWEGVGLTAGLTEYGLMVFTEGDCWALAWHLAQQTGGTLCLVGDHRDGDGRCLWEHVVVLLPDATCAALGRTDVDLYLDANGVSTAEEIASSWWHRPRTMNPAEAADLRTYRLALSLVEGEEYPFSFQISHGEVAEVARLLIAKHLAAPSDGIAPREAA